METQFLDNILHFLLPQPRVAKDFTPLNDNKSKKKKIFPISPVKNMSLYENSTIGKVEHSVKSSKAEEETGLGAYKGDIVHQWTKGQKRMQEDLSYVVIRISQILKNVWLPRIKTPPMIIT